MKCGIIRDLMPSYMDELTCEDSNQAIKEHLQKCEACRQYYQAVRPDVIEQEIKDLQLLKSFERKRRGLSALLYGCLAAIVIIMIVITAANTQGIFTMVIPYEKAQPYVEISEQSTVTTHYDGNTEYKYYWRGIYTTYKIGVLDYYGENYEVHRLPIGGEEKTVILISAYTSASEYREHKDTLGDASLKDGNGHSWNGSKELDDFNKLDLVYYLDKNAEKTKNMSEEKVLEWIEKYGHLVWSKTSE